MPAEALSSTQIGAIAENVVVNALMKQSKGRLAPFLSVADDDGIDLLVYDKRTGSAVPIQVKSRTAPLKRSGSAEPGKVVHFEVRAAALREYELAHVVAVLLSPDLDSIRCAWFIPMRDIRGNARASADKFVIRASFAPTSKDRFSPYRCDADAGLAQRVLKALANGGSSASP